jgi:hypothetical protein
VDWWQSQSWVEQQVLTILGTLGVAWVISILLFIHYVVTPSHFIIHVFSAFVGALVFFSIIGAVVTIMLFRK